MIEWVWSTGGMTLTGQHQSSRRETCSITTLCNSHPTWTGLRLNLGLQDGRLVTKYCSHSMVLNPLNPELNPICYLLALLGAHHFLHVSRIRVKLLTFRLLMSYIYIYIYMEHPFLMFLDHTQRLSTVGRTPLDEWSARRRDLYLTTHDTHNRQISMPRWDSNPRSQHPTGGMDICLLWVSCVVR